MSAILFDFFVNVDRTFVYFISGTADVLAVLPDCGQMLGVCLDAIEALGEFDTLEFIAVVAGGHVDRDERLIMPAEPASHFDEILIEAGGGFALD